MFSAEEYRTFCLSLGEVGEKMPFGKFAARYASIIAFYVEGHMFSYADIASFETIYLKVHPEVVDELYAGYTAVGAPLNMSKRHWIGINIRDDMSWSQIQELLREAFKIVQKQYGVVHKSLH